MNSKIAFVILRHAQQKNNSIILIYFFPDVPIVKLEFGSSLNTENIKEGDDAYFECHVDARPEITKIQWFHNVSITTLDVLPTTDMLDDVLSLLFPHSCNKLWSGRSSNMTYNKLQPLV